MTNTLQPQFIKQDSAVPIRMIAGGWVVATIAAIVEDPLENTRLVVVGLALLGGGLMAASLFADRTWRMLIGSGAGAVTAWQGWKFGVDERLIPWLDGPERLDTLDRHLFASIAFGLGVLSIGLGGLLEALRSQSERGRSPLPARLALVAIGVGIAVAACSLAGVSGGPMILVAVAAATLLGALAWFRRDIPEGDYQPSP